MAYEARVYNVMIASPSDVAAERNVVRQVLADWNVVHSERRRLVLLPLGWETHASPQMGEHPQKILNKQLLARSDLLIGVFWTRLGTPTGTHPSGSVEEIEEHQRAGKPVMLYFSNQPVRPDSVDSEQYANLLSFKASCRERGLLEEYDDLSDFRDKFSRQLQLRLNEDLYFQTSEASDSEPGLSVLGFPPPQPHMSTEARLLLAAAAQGDGTVLRVNHFAGTDVTAGGRDFIEGSDRRTIARWEAGIDELERLGLIEDKVGKGEVYSVTHEGFRVAEDLPEEA